MSTQGFSGFGITRNIDYAGCTLSASATHEDLVYTLTGSRDAIAAQIRFVADTVTRPAFKPWEINDFTYRMKVDIARAKENPQAVLMEALHRVAFRGGLSHSILSPEFMVGHHDHNLLMSYVADNFVANRMAVVGLGVECDGLAEAVEKNFSLNTVQAKASDSSKFIGGEVRVDTASPVTYVAVVGEGVGIKNNKDVLALSVFQQILGTGTRVPYSEGGNSRLGKAAAKATQNPFAVSGINVSYSDNGLFGFVVAGSANDMDKIVKSVVSGMRDAAKNVKDADVNVAKNQLKAAVLMSAENQCLVLEEMGAQALNLGQVLSTNEVLKAIDGVTLQDVTSAASRVVKSKGAMASVGQLHNAPYLEDLV
jgi:ubiquinol-cytochrome c reductase core subunit 2